MKALADPRQLRFGFVADCEARLSVETAWTRPRRCAPALDHVLGEEVVVHDGHGDGHVCRIAARLQSSRKKLVIVRWRNAGGTLEFCERDGAATTKRDQRWMIAEADVAYLAANPSTFDDRGEARLGARTKFVNTRFQRQRRAAQ